MHATPEAARSTNSTASRALSSRNVATQASAGAQVAAPVLDPAPPGDGFLLAAPGLAPLCADLGQLPQRCKDLPGKPLAMGAADDPCEREAEQVADLVTGSAPSVSPSLARSLLPPLPELSQSASRPLQARLRPMVASAPAHAVPGSVQRVLDSPGQALEGGARTLMQNRLGHDFSQVKVHTDARAAQSALDMQADAYTLGPHIAFAPGRYQPSSRAGLHLLAHELTHVVQQNPAAGGAHVPAAQGLLQRKPTPGARVAEDYVAFRTLVPEDYTSLEQMFRLFERVAYGREVNHPWQYDTSRTIADYRGKQVSFNALKSEITGLADPAQEEQRTESKAQFGQLTGKKKQQVAAEVDRRYYKDSGDPAGRKIGAHEEGQKRIWQDNLNQVMQEEAQLQALPPEVSVLLGGQASWRPADYQHLLKIAARLKQFSTEDLAVYQLLAIRATDNLDLFEQSVDLFLARKAELQKALAAQQAAPPDQKKATLRDQLDQQWQGFDDKAVAGMSEDQRYALARKKTWDLTGAQLRFMKDHPGQTALDFAKSAALVNSGESLSAIGKDWTEMTNADANTWARWAAGTGGGAKLTGWMLAAAGVLYAASWLTGIGELATIGLGAAILLGSTVTLSLAESELRIKAASQATTPEEFRRNTELAAAARSNVIVAVAMIAVALVLHFTAKRLFPKTVEKIGTSLKNFREKIRLRGSIYELKPQIAAKMASIKSELAESTAAAAKDAQDAGNAMARLSNEEFAAKLDAGEGGLYDQSILPPEQRIRFGELLKTPEGQQAVAGYKARLVKALTTDVPQAIARMAQEHQAKIDAFLEEVAAAKNHDDLGLALNQLEGALTPEARSQAMTAMRDAIVQKNAAEAESNLKAELAEAEAQAKIRQAAEAEARAKLAAEAEAKAKQEAETKARQEAETKARQEAETKARQEAETKARQEAETKAKQEAEAKAKQEAEAKAKQEAEAKAKQEAEAKAKQEAEAKAAPAGKKPKAKPAKAAPAALTPEEQVAVAWLDEIGKGLSSEGQARLAGIRNNKSPLDARAIIEKKGGKDFLEGKLDKPKPVSTPQALSEFANLQNDPVFLARSKVREAAAIVKEDAAVDVIRSQMAAEIALRRVKADYAGQNNIQVYEDVQILREQPGFKTVEEFKAANPGKRGPVYQRGGKVYRPVTDMDILVTEKDPLGGPEKILERDEIKSGANDTPSGAGEQLDNAKAALKQLAAGDKGIRIEFSDGTDATSRFDPASGDASKSATVGPLSEKTGWAKTLGVSAEELLPLAQAILAKLKAKK